MSCTVEDDAAVIHIVEAQQAAAEGRFAATGFADQADRLAGENIQRDIREGMDMLDAAGAEAAADAEGLRDTRRVEHDVAPDHAATPFARIARSWGQSGSPFSARKQEASCAPLPNSGGRWPQGS